LHASQEGLSNMSVKSFKFVSPGVFVNEIDNSFRPQNPQEIGPVVIGRSSRGLAMQPIKVESYSQFVQAFGDTVPGAGGANDVYRDGNYQSPMYGTYAAKAFLQPSVAPVTYMRLLGQQTAAGGSAGGAAGAGWDTSQDLGTDPETVGGAYGLWVCQSGTVADLTAANNNLELAAIFYMNTGSISLKGAPLEIAGTGAVGDRGTSITQQGVLIGTDSDGLFNIVVSGTLNGNGQEFKFNFNDDSANFVRRKLNTNPQLLAGGFYPSASLQDFWVGETFEQELRDINFTTDTSLQGVILGIGLSGSTGTGPQDMKQASREAVAGWFIGQDLSGDAANYAPAAQQKLFRLKGRGHGEWLHKNVKVSIGKVRQSSSRVSDYGTFSVILRDVRDTDNKVVVIERFDNCTLDPTSPDYIGRKIGTKYTSWDSNERRLKTYGEYDNKSDFVYVEVNDAVDQGSANSLYLPFGYFGPPSFTGLTGVTSTSPGTTTPFIIGHAGLPGGASTVDAPADAFVQVAHGGAGVGNAWCLSDATVTLNFPKDRMRLSASAGGLSNPTDAYWGWSTVRTPSSSAGSTRYDRSVNDWHRLLYADFPADPTNGTGGALAAVNTTAGVDNWSYVFSLDNIMMGTNGAYRYISGSRTDERAVSTGSYTALLDAGMNQFTAPFWGGFDGWDITKPDPLYNRGMTSAATEDNSYAYHTYARAIDTLADPETLDMNLVAAPGLTNKTLTERMINMCEARGDALALIDLPDVYYPASEQYYADKSNRIGTTPVQAASSLKDRRIDSSYGATFYPWVQTRDQTGQMLWIPPSIAMMGVLASSEKKSKVWFAPAGFNRGGLSEGAAGIPITGVTEKLTSKNRDTLYEAGINPIASFPSSGIVVFGQKTLQERASALDRINVRRMVIYLKKQISILSTQVLFEQNVQATWNRFKSLIEPLLANTKVDFGITDYKLILDESTTTPDLIDQNVMYAKIMVKPARAIEYIAIDFVIASTGASFDD